ncbi:MAG: response regulator [Anaerolineae bacterium]|nr:response regulator [Anaerolineae bacterium]
MMEPKKSTVSSDTPETVLIVDDTLHNLNLLVMMLSAEGYKTLSAESGVDALKIVTTTSPDLILLDINMPEMTGYEVCEHLQKDVRTRDIPIIFLSALDAIHDKVRALTIGGVDYITKPFNVEEVLARVRTQLSLRKLQTELQATNLELTQSLADLAHANAQLAHTNKQLKRRNEELDAFAHTVAHDLKNPLSVAIIYSTILEQQSYQLTPDKIQHYAQIIMQSERKMDSIIRELLLLASVRQEDIKAEPLEMGNIVTEALKHLDNMRKAHQANIIVPEVWPVALGYAPWIEAVWTNYISNALKYGGRKDEGLAPQITLGFDKATKRRVGEWQPGDIHEQCESTATYISEQTSSTPENPEQQVQIRFWVQDNGKGLSSAQQAYLFMPFERLGQTQIEGHGLGLSVVRRIIEKLGGEVGVESHPDYGSTFFFTLPAAQGDET